MIDSLLHSLQSSLINPENENAVLSHGSRLSSLCESEIVTLFGQLVGFADKNSELDWPRQLLLLFSGASAVDLKTWLPAQCIESVVRLYKQCPANHICRNQLLAVLAGVSSEASINHWCELICSDPPTTSEGLQSAFAPFVQNDSQILPEHLLNRLVNHATHHSHVAAAIYELANHEFRLERIEQHPASERTEALTELLGGLVGRLSLIEEGKLPPGATPESVAQTVQDSISLIIAILDTLSLLNVKSATGKFNQAFELRHRRIQVEAAAALARIGEDEGKQKLVELAQHPVVRPRVIAYAAELGIDEEISLEHRGPIASAESQLALWLSQPQQMGLAPTSMALLDQRELYWPSYEEPVSCFLFSFDYGTCESGYQNIGISGPLTHAFTTDLRMFSFADQFSAFAGWQTVSDEIFTVPIARAEKNLATEIERLKRRLANETVQDSQIDSLARFFGEYLLVVSGIREGKPGTLIVHTDGADWITAGSENAPIGWQLAFDIWKGRKLLLNFNPAFS